jgi:hypothetical protein
MSGIKADTDKQFKEKFGGGRGAEEKSFKPKFLAPVLLT